MIKQIYIIEHNGCCWQSIFPSSEAHLSQLHKTKADAAIYMIDECNIDPSLIEVRKATTKDLGIAIRDFLEEKMFSHFIEKNGELIDDDHPCFPIDHIDVSDASTPIVHLENGQQFIIRIFAR